MNVLCMGEAVPGRVVYKSFHRPFKIPVEVGAYKQRAGLRHNEILLDAEKENSTVFSNKSCSEQHEHSPFYAICI